VKKIMRVRKWPSIEELRENREENSLSTLAIATTVALRADRFTQIVKNMYRVLPTRGIEGRYVHFMDKNTENFFRSRMEHTCKS
jgi:DUF2075 family protein